MSIFAFLVAVIALLSPTLFQDQNQEQVTEPATKTKFYKALGDMDITGVAVRSRYWVKVYALAFYADTEAVKERLGSNEANTDNLANAIIYSQGHRALVMHFVRNVSKDSIQGAFREGIEKSIKLDDPRIADDAKTFLDSMTDVTKGDWVEMYFDADGATRLRGNGEEIVQVENRLLQESIIKIYLGSRPISGGIKRDLLKLF